MHHGIQLPPVIVRSSGDSSASEDILTLDEHFFAGREHIAIGDHEILGNMGIGHNHKELIPEPDGVQVSEFLSPVVQSQLRKSGERIEGALNMSATVSHFLCLDS